MRSNRLRIACKLLAVTCGAICALPSLVAAQEPTGRIAGMIIDASNGRPLALVGVSFVEADRIVVTDPNGRYRSAALPPGQHTVRAVALGYAVVERTVTVSADGTVTLDFALQPQAIDIGGITVEVTATTQTATVDALLAAQRVAPSVSDGISAEQISRSPSSDAGDAIARATGVSVVDGRFVVVRGLAERYSNTLLNGAELASPEPTRRIVPMDVFPASLLESVVTTKTATPDRPGDFAGGSVDIKTKEFPEESVFEIEVSQGFDDLTTFRKVPMMGLQGRDYLGFDGQGRAPATAVSNDQAFAKGLRSEWSPPMSRALPNLGLGLTLGGQVGEFERALGYVVSVDYGKGASYDPNRFFAFIDDVVRGDLLLEGLSRESTTTVDWGAVGNFALRLGSSHTLSLKNLVTREAEERFLTRIGFDPEVQAGTEYGDQVRTFQSRYLTRTLAQSQLGGRHFLGGLLGSTVEWSGSFTYAGRDEPENRSINQIINTDLGRWEVNGTEANPYWFRFLDEVSYNGKIDWLTPLGIRNAGDLQVKVGAAARVRRREFDSRLYSLTPPANIPDGSDVLALPPDLLVTPENLGRNIRWEEQGIAGLPYDASDDVYAGYAMLDVTPFDRLRLVSGVRAEQWKLFVQVPNVLDAARNNLDWLWSVNATVRVAADHNVRLAAFRSVSRPDPREVSITKYSEVTNECAAVGNPQLQRAVIDNADVRWEWFPNPGEIISLSGFWKRFRDPFIQVVAVSSLSCLLFPENAESAENYGAEVDLRKSLGFLGEALEPLSVSINVTYTDGAITPKPENGIGDEDLPLIDQSRWLGNASLAWLSRDGDLELSVLGQFVGDRVRRYGDRTYDQATNTFYRTPDAYELGRLTFDAKIAKTVGDLTLSLSGRNLTAEPFESVQQTEQVGALTTAFQSGVRSFSLTLGYRIW
jgi:hypothetical protein